MAHRVGAKPLPLRGERRSRFVKVNLTPGELARVVELAAGQSVSAWLYGQIEHLLTDAPVPSDPNQTALPLESE